MYNSKAIAEQLYQAEMSASPVDPLTAMHPGLTVEQAMRCNSKGWLFDWSGIPERW